MDANIQSDGECLECRHAEKEIQRLNADAKELHEENQKLLNFIGGVMAYKGFVFSEDEKKAVSLICNQK